MRKLILSIFLALSLDIYGNPINPQEFNNHFLQLKGDDIFDRDSPTKIFQLINKIEIEGSESKKQILSVLLELELDNLDCCINRNIKSLENSIENSKKSMDKDAYLEIRAGYDLIQQAEEALQIISNWRDKYVRQS